MTELLPEAEFQSVRYAIDQRLTITSLSDAMISNRIYKDRATRYVLSRVPAYDPDNEVHVALATEAVVLYCASLLVFAVVDATSIKVTARDSSYSKQAWKPEDKEKALKGEANEVIVTLNDIISGTPPSESISQRLTTNFSSVAGNRMKLT